MNGKNTTPAQQIVAASTAGDQMLPAGHVQAARLRVEEAEDSRKALTEARRRLDGDLVLWEQETERARQAGRGGDQQHPCADRGEIA